MIKLFRKVRQRLLSENKFSKYLIYAIGEIILVVIGILIALNINNKNELQKNEKTVVLALKEIQNNLLEDIANSQLNINTYLKSDSLQKKILDTNNSLTFEDYKNGRVQPLGNFYYDFVINKNGYDNLMRHIDILPIKYTPALKNIKKLYVNINEGIQVYNERIRSTVYTNIDFTHTKNWNVYRLKFDDISNEEINYYVNDEAYKRYVAKFMNDRGNVFVLSQRYRIKAIETYIEIDSLLNEKDKVLPLQMLGKIPLENDVKKYVGDYKFEDNTIPLTINLYLKQNQFYSNDNTNYKLKHYKINDELYMYLDPNQNYPVIWKFMVTESGKLGVDFLNVNLPNLEKMTIN
ncbi:MAG: hypothetical protein KBT58_03370 [Bizionia sp.]|nr:hypothetical protein [Bizionia sp.]